MFYYYPYLIWEHIFQLGWFNHQLEMRPSLPKTYPIPSHHFLGVELRPQKARPYTPEKQKNALQASFKKIDPEQLDRLATGARWRFRLASGGGDSVGGKTGKGAYGGFLMVVPPNHPNLIGFSIINHPFWGTSIFGNTQSQSSCQFP